MVRVDINLANDIREDVMQKQKKGFKFSTWIQTKYREEFMTTVGLNKQIAAARAQQESYKKQEESLMEKVQKQVEHASATYKTLGLKAKQFLNGYDLMMQKDASDYSLFLRFCREFKEVNYEEFQLLLKIRKGEE